MGAQHTTPLPKSFPLVPLLVLSALIFTFVTSEFLPTGLLPEIAGELEVSESQVGFLVTIFAGTVVLTTAPLTSLTRSHSRKSLMIVLILVFVLGNILAAVAPNYAVLAVARVIGGLAHGLFWSVVGAYTAGLVPKRHIGRAVAITGGGATAAFILGVPVGTALGHVLGWRLTFVAIGAIVLVLTLVVVRFLPPIQHIERLATGEIPLPMRKDRTLPGVVIICAIVLIVMMAHNIFYTYIAPYLIGPVGIDPGSVAGILFLYGGAGAVGLVIAGAVSDRFPRSGFVVAIGLVAVAVLIIAIFPGVQWLTIVAIVLWGAAFGGAPSMLQARILHTASPRIRDSASAYLTTSFNFAIGSGAFIGGVLLDRTSILVLPFVDVALSVVGIAVALIGDAWLRRRSLRLSK
jgi:DHA1 family inner membrane transport protein